MKVPEIFRDFEPDRVKRLRDACVAIGRAFQAKTEKAKTRDEYNFASLVAATYFRRSAANSILIDEFSIAREWFGEAARCYKFAGMPYGVLMEAMGGIQVGDWSWEKTAESPQGVYALIAGLGRKMGNSNALRKARHNLDEFRGQRLGVFALPVDQYLDLFDAVYSAAEEPDKGLRVLRQALLPFVQTYSSALHRAKRDKFHWERLAMVFHPAEPDIVGLLALTARALERTRVTREDLLVNLPVSHDAAAVLLYCLAHTRDPNNRMEGNEE